MDRLVKKDLRHIWHPFTQMKDCEELPPILIERAKGLKLFDNKGNFYYDTISSWWCNVHGHNHPGIKKAIKTQLDSLEHVLFAGFTHRPAIELAERLVSITPKNLTRVFFSDNGSTAIETALKMSFQYWRNMGNRGKTKFVSLDRGYHGDTIGAMSVSGMSMFNEIFSTLFFKSFKADSPYCYRCPAGKKSETCNCECIGSLKGILERHTDEIAAIILEPLVMAAGGMIIYPAEYLRRAAALAKQYNVHLILDEVATGFGRTGKMFACEYVKGIEPDFMCLSKGITAGYLPLGAALTTNKIYSAFYADYAKKKTFFHGHTYTANPVSCAAAIASLDIFKKDRTLERIKGIIRLFHDELERFRPLSVVGDVRHIGMIGALELVKNRRTKKPFGFEKRVGFEIYKLGLKNKLVLRPLGNVIYLFLPLCTTRQELVYISNTTRQILST